MKLWKVNHATWKGSFALNLSRQEYNVVTEVAG